MGLIILIDDGKTNLKQLKRVLDGVLAGLPLSPNPTADCKIELVFVQDSKAAESSKTVVDGMTVVDAETVVKLIADKSVDLIISDFNMPGMNGAEMAINIPAALKAKNKTVPHIVLWTSEVLPSENNANAVAAFEARLQPHLFSECVYGKSLDNERWKSIIRKWLPATSKTNTDKLPALASPHGGNHTAAASNPPPADNKTVLPAITNKGTRLPPVFMSSRRLSPLPSSTAASSSTTSAASTTTPTPTSSIAKTLASAKQFTFLNRQQRRLTPEKSQTDPFPAPRSLVPSPCNSRPSTSLMHSRTLPVPILVM